jgi:transcriptional regulator with XRE-family HTH domain
MSMSHKMRLDAVFPVMEISGSDMEITGSQSRLARALSGWSARELAEAAEVSLSSVQRFEGEQIETIALARKAIAAAFEREGVEFIEGGARLKPKRKK